MFFSRYEEGSLPSSTPTSSERYIVICFINIKYDVLYVFYHQYFSENVSDDSFNDSINSDSDYASSFTTFSSFCLHR